MAVHIAPWWLCCIFTCPVQNCHDHTAGPAPWQQAQWHDFYELQEKQIAKQSNPVMQSTDLAIQTRILNPTHPVVNISQQEPSRKAIIAAQRDWEKKRTFLLLQKTAVGVSVGSAWLKTTKSRPQKKRDCYDLSWSASLSAITSILYHTRVVEPVTSWMRSNQVLTHILERSVLLNCCQDNFLVVPAGNWCRF